MTTTRKNQEDFCSPFQSLFCSRCKYQHAKFCVNYKMANSIITYFMPYLMAADVIGNSSPARNHPESASPRTLTLDPAILSLKASLSKLRITPTPPALKHEKPNITVYTTRILFYNMCAIWFRNVKNSSTILQNLFFPSLKHANLPQNWQLWRTNDLHKFRMIYKMTTNKKDCRC